MEQVFSSHFRAKLAEIAEIYRKNWLKSIGVLFLAQASMEYFSHHLFGCSLLAILLLTYAMYVLNKKCQVAELAQDVSEADSCFFLLVVSSVVWLVMLAVALNSAPQEWGLFRSLH